MNQKISKIPEFGFSPGQNSRTQEDILSFFQFLIWGNFGFTGSGYRLKDPT
jgi:hypothetical protein